MEKLTFASLAHLPTAVIFVIDPTGLSGEKSTLMAQLNVRKHLKERFPKRPWLDVVSKGAECYDNCDLALRRPMLPPAMLDLLPDMMSQDTTWHCCNPSTLIWVTRTWSRHISHVILLLSVPALIEPVIEARHPTSFPSLPFLFLFSLASPLFLPLPSLGDLEVSPEVVALLPEGYLPVSVKSGQNVVQLRENIEEMLLNLTHILQQRQDSRDAEEN